VVNKETSDITEQLDEPKLDLHGFERPRELLGQIVEDLACLLELVKRPVVSARQFNRDQLLQLSRRAARLEPKPLRRQRPRPVKLLISDF